MNPTYHQINCDYQFCVFLLINQVTLKTKLICPIKISRSWQAISSFRFYQTKEKEGKKVGRNQSNNVKLTLRAWKDQTTNSDHSLIFIPFSAWGTISTSIGHRIRRFLIKAFAITSITLFNPTTKLNFKLAKEVVDQIIYMLR